MSNAVPPLTSTNRRLIAAGFICLFIGAFYDIIRGPLLPPLSKELGLSFSDSGWFLALGNISAASATVVMIWLTNRFALETTISVLCSIGLMVCVLAPFVSNFPLLIVLSILIGGLVSMLGSLSNILVVTGTPADRQGKMLSALHTIYGVGAAFASWIVGVSIKEGAPWWVLFTGALPLFTCLWLLASRGNKKENEPSEARFQSPKLLGFQYWVILIFCLYVAGEVTASMWMTTWLLNVKGYAIEEATQILSSYFGVLLVTRFLCALFLRQKTEKILLIVCLLMPASAMFLVLTDHLHPWFFVLLGLYGPFFPVFLARISRSSPRNWRSVVIWNIVAMNVLLGAGNLVLGKLANSLGIGKAFFLPCLALIAAMLLLCGYFAYENVAQTELIDHPR